MISFNLYEIAPILNAKVFGSNMVIDTITIDSNIIYEKCMFIALLGKRFDGHDFVEQAVRSGAQALLVNYYLLLDISQLVVLDTRIALMRLANWVRRQVSTKIIAITGSSGKTSVKEMTTAILKNRGRTISTRGNLNNDIGVSITLLRLTKLCKFAVIEIGISSPGELEKLSEMVSADIVLVNNIYPSHLCNFQSLFELKKEKGKIFKSLSEYGIGIINADNHALSLWYKDLYGKTIWRFSVKKIDVEFFSSNIHFYKNGVIFNLHSPFGISKISLSMLGIYNVANALAAAALAGSVGASFFEIVFGLNNVKTSIGRLFPINLGYGKLLLDDTYNSNVGSMMSSIFVLNRLSGYRILVISDMLELGELDSIKYHYDIGKLLIKTKIHKVLTIGNISYLISKICGKGIHFHNKYELIVYLKKVLFHYKLINILIKGSRLFKMEQIVSEIVKDQSTC